MRGFLIGLMVFGLATSCFAQDAPIKHREASPVVIEVEGTIDDASSGASFFPSTGNGYFLMAAVISAMDNIEIEISASKATIDSPPAIVKTHVLASRPTVIHAGGYPIYATKKNEGFNISSDTGSKIVLTLFGFEYTD